MTGVSLLDPIRRIKCQLTNRWNLGETVHWIVSVSRTLNPTPIETRDPRIIRRMISGRDRRCYEFYLEFRGQILFSPVKGKENR